LSIDNEDREHALRTLEMLAFAKRPLRVEEVAEAVIIVPGSKPFDIDDRFFDPRDILSICAGLVNRTQDTNDLVLAHYSVQEFLLSHRIHRSIAASFGLDQEMSQRRIAETCLTYILSFEATTALYTGIEDDYPFLEYASQHWLDHVAPGIIESPSMLRSLVLSLMRRWEDEQRFDWSELLDPDLFYSYDCYLQGREGSESRLKPSSIDLTCLLRRLDIALFLLETGPPFHAHGEDCHSLLQSAIKESIYSVVKRLAMAGCDLNVTFPDGSDALCVASGRGDVPMITTLLSLGANVHGSSASHPQANLPTDRRYPQTPLHVAARYHHIEIVRLLLKAGADLDAVGGKFASVLSTTLGSNTRTEQPPLELVRLLIESGADVNMRSADFGTPLNTFLSRLFPPQTINPEIIQVLSKLSEEVDEHIMEGGMVIRRATSDKGREEYGIVLHNLAFTIQNSELDKEVEQVPKALPPIQMLTSDSLGAGAPYLADVSTMVQLLLSAGADPNTPGRLYPFTVRERAWKYQWRSNFYSLIKAGANLDLLGPDWGTPLQAVCSLPFESTHTVSVLLKAGANPNLYDAEADCPLNMAQNRGYIGIVTLLTAAGAKPVSGAKRPHGEPSKFNAAYFMTEGFDMQRRCREDPQNHSGLTRFRPKGMFSFTIP
jgi:ankyrin repeat protein